MIVNLLISTLFPRLCDRALMTACRHGADVDFLPVVVGPDPPVRKEILFCEQRERLGSNAANRFGLEHIEDDAIVVLAADDVMFTRDWLKQALPNFLAAEEASNGLPIIMGLRHMGGIGTTYGHMYANFPMFRKSLLKDYDGIARGFCPEWLVGQWGDCAFGMSVWREGGGRVVDSGTDVLIRWGDRMAHPESPMKYEPQERDMTAFQEHFNDFAYGWPRTFRSFNVDCSPAMLVDGTIEEPDYTKFVQRYREYHPQ